MPTIHDLNAAFAHLERSAPTDLADVAGPANVHPLVRTDRRPRRALTAIGGSVAVAATVAGLVIASSIHGSGHSPTAAADSPSASAPASSAAAAQSAAATPTPLPALLAIPHFTVRGLPAGLRLFTDYSDQLLQQTALARTGDDDAVNLLFSRASEWKPTIPADAVQVSINGSTGYYSAGFDLSKAPAEANIWPGTAAGVAWQPAPGYWAFAVQLGDLSSTHTQLSQQDLVATAAAVYSDGPNSARLTPVKFGYLPAGLVLFDTTTIYRSATDIDVRFDLGPADGDTRGTLSIELETTSNVGGDSFTVNGLHGSYDPTLVRVGNGKLEISLYGSAAAPVTRDDATKMLQAVTVAGNLKSTTGWFPLASALPLS